MNSYFRSLPGIILLGTLALPSGEVPFLRPLDRKELSNKSNQEWKLVLVEGNREGAGRMQFIDKFSGKRLKTLEKVGDSIIIPPGARYLIEFATENQFVFHDFILQDARGDYAEYIATVPYLSNPRLNLSFKDRHIQSPWEGAEAEGAQASLENVINTENDNLIIVQGFVCPKASSQPSR